MFLPVSPYFANERSPNVRAFVGVLKRAQEKDQAVSIYRAQYLAYVEGELMPELEDGDDGFLAGSHAPTATPPAEAAHVVPALGVLTDA